jgi:methylated-DNA-[protein]-cysteine S-methyltransferase
MPRAAGGRCACQPYAAVVSTPLGALGLVLAPTGALVRLDYLDRPARPYALPQAASLAQQLQAALTTGKPLPEWVLAPAGTAFQQRVWRALRAIPSGQTLTYGVLARRLKSGARAVAAACRANPIPVLIPCHRVLAVSGLGGYDGATAGPKLARKLWLLRSEGACLP